MVDKDIVICKSCGKEVSIVDTFSYSQSYEDDTEEEIFYLCKECDELESDDIIETSKKYMVMDTFLFL